MRLRCLLLFACALLAACTSVRSNDFSVMAESHQQVAIDGVKQVVLRCYCFRRRIVEVPSLPQIELESKTKYDSVGYHGKQKKPKTIDDTAMRFIEWRDGGTLILESRERKHVHHAFLLSDLELRIPAGLAYTVEPLTFEQLEGRRPDADQ